MKKRFKIESDKHGAQIRDTESDQIMYSLIAGSTRIPNETTARVLCFEILASKVLTRTWKVSSCERFYWLVVATEFAADDAMADAMENCPDDCYPEDWEPAAEIDGPRHHIYQAQWELDQNEDMNK